MSVAPRFNKFVGAPDENGCMNWTGYAHRGYGRFGLGGRELGIAEAHRVAWALAGRQPPPPGMHLDHACRNKLCVNPDHLRHATPSQNGANTGKRRNAKWSQYRGVCFDKSRGAWLASIVVNRRQRHLGYFSTEAGAALAYNEAAAIAFGEFAFQNDVERAA